MKHHFVLEENSVLVGNNHQTSNVYANVITLLDATPVSFLIFLSMKRFTRLTCVF